MVDFVLLCRYAAWLKSDAARDHLVGSGATLGKESKKDFLLRTAKHHDGHTAFEHGEAGRDHLTGAAQLASSRSSSSNSSGGREENGGQRSDAACPVTPGGGAMMNWFSRKEEQHDVVRRTRKQVTPASRAL